MTSQRAEDHLLDHQELVEQAVLLLRGIYEPFGELASHRKNCIERNVIV